MPMIDVYASEGTFGDPVSWPRTWRPPLCAGSRSLTWPCSGTTPSPSSQMPPTASSGSPGETITYGSRYLPQLLPSTGTSSSAW